MKLTNVSLHELRRPIIAIKVGETEIPSQWSFLSDSVYVSETPVNVSQARPSDQVLDRIRHAISFRRCNTIGRGLLTATSAILIALAIMLSYQYTQTLNERRRALAERDGAEKLIDYLVTDLKQALRPLGRLALLRDPAIRALDYFDEVHISDAIDIERLKSHWRAANNLSEVQIDTGEIVEARKTLDTSIELAKKIKQVNRNSMMLSRSYHMLGEILKKQNKLEEARNIFQSSLTLVKKEAEKNPGDTKIIREQITINTKLADLTARQGDLTDAIEWHRTNIGILDEILRTSKDLEPWLGDKLVAYANLGELYMQKQDLLKSTDAYDMAHDIAQQRYKENPHDFQVQRGLAITLDRLGHLKLKQGQMAEAIDFYTESRQLTEDLAMHDPDNGDWQNDLASSWDYLGNAYLQQNNLDQGAQLYQRALDIRTQLSEKHPANPAWKRSLAISYHKVGKVAYRRKQYRQAIEAFQNSQFVFSKQSIASDSDAEIEEYLAINYRMLAVIHRDAGELDKAIIACRESQRIISQLSTLEPEKWQNRAQELETLCTSLSQNGT